MKTKRKASEIRETFLEFFKSKSHKIVPSAPIVNKNDPTLMFTNAGMNQFKDFFLGHAISESPRIADTQKCLRVSGKHNDLEEVGIDSYHHTMFEMLGNWSFGDYFKKEAISWAYELLVDVYGLDKDRLYVSVFGGDEHEGLDRDTEAAQIWEKIVGPDRILDFGKKDNFWEMGDTGPCGPCSEIHYDLRSDEERNKIPGKSLVNQDHPLVIEIWNLVFIQFNRKADGQLDNLPDKHVDTGMGFERLCMAIQGKTSNYDTDVFTPFIEEIERLTGKKYGFKYEREARKDIAFRVVADHIRTVAFTIADGELPSNTGAGYVIRRILRRAVRYYYSFLDWKEPLMFRLVPMLAEYFAHVFPELDKQKEFVATVVLEEEKSFLKTLESGLKRFENLTVKNNVINGFEAFELYDTFGFPIDLTRLIASEKGYTIDEAGFEKALQEQKSRSREDARSSRGDWIQLIPDTNVHFVGYHQLSLKNVPVVKYRQVEKKDLTEYHIVLAETPFYAEGGGQIGDTGYLLAGNERIRIINTIKENDLIIHITDAIPGNFSGLVDAFVDMERRQLTENNHSATHLMQAALRKVLGKHAQQRGSLVTDKYLRFDFSHFQKMTPEQIAEVESIVQAKIRENISRKEDADISIADAEKAGAMMLFGEKYGEKVRMITFDPEYSAELCGGCHVDNTARIGTFKILSESAIAAGIRRIEAVTSVEADRYIGRELNELNEIRGLFKNQGNMIQHVTQLQEENKLLRKEIEKLMAEQANQFKDVLKNKVETVDGIKLLASTVPFTDQKAVKTLAYNIEQELGDMIIVLGMVTNETPQLMVVISKNLTEKGYHAGNMIRELAKEIGGGGGGQAFFATAGGKNAAGLQQAILKVKSMIQK
ncbi:MAG TPA: alanine--tRNA ligase [Saprospirales bacterium]|nr:alanine--tRNA ligase [Saprospirales bacterium]HRQ29017.1 alanine--tRNA ligase [Saprospiraceae bacterium]